MEKFKAIIIIIILFASCKPTAQSPTTCLEVKVVNKTGLDGCGYLLETENQSYLEPDNLETKYRVDGTKLCITYKKVNKFSVCMAGEMITLTSVKKIK